MSFNIRYGTARDGDNAWPKRKDFVVDTIKAFKPDVLGTQETLGFQRDYLAKHLPGYGVLGVGRNDGKDKGEMMAVYYRKDRFEKLAGGHFWLSETPDKIGSKSWDSSLPRMVTWLKLKDKKTGKPFMFYNTHFDHRGPTARLESAKLIRKRVAALDNDMPAIVTGDFNNGEGAAPYKAMFATTKENDSETPSPLLDTYRARVPVRAKNEGTFSAFGKNVGSARIDWIGVTKHWEIKDAQIDRTNRDGVAPSDHFPVTAVLRLPEKLGVAANHPLVGRWKCVNKLEPPLSAITTQFNADGTATIEVVVDDGNKTISAARFEVDGNKLTVKPHSKNENTQFTTWSVEENKLTLTWTTSDKPWSRQFEREQ